MRSRVLIMVALATASIAAAGIYVVREAVDARDGVAGDRADPLWSSGARGRELPKAVHRLPARLAVTIPPATG